MKEEVKMNRLEKSYLNGKIWAKKKAEQFIYDERGDVNVVSIVVLIGVAIVLAVVFKKQASKLIKNLFSQITTNAEDAIK